MTSHPNTSKPLAIVPDDHVQLQTKTNTRMVLSIGDSVCVCVRACVCVMIHPARLERYTLTSALSAFAFAASAAIPAHAS